MWCDSEDDTSFGDSETINRVVQSVRKYIMHIGFQSRSLKML